MKSVWQWVLLQKLGEVWVRISIYGFIGLATAVVAGVLAPLIPSLNRESVDRDTVLTMLQILSSSMLAVTTFSVSVMVTAKFNAAGGATPRVTALLKNDRTSQNVLATFVGAFVYSLVSIIGLQLSAYGAGGRLILLVVTVAVLVAVVVQLVRWINHLGTFGLMSDTIERITEAAEKALQVRMSDPFLGGRPLTMEFDAAVAAGRPVRSNRVGYVQMVDMEALNTVAERAGVSFALTALPGAFVHTGQQVGVVLSPGTLSDTACAEMCKAFAIGATRTYEQDPRFGVLTLTEIASRALSPAVNDPGTAIDVLGRQLRVLSHWQARATPELRFRSVMVKGLELDDLMSDAFGAIARDGAGLVEVQVRLQKMLIGLVRQAPDIYGKHALRVSHRAVGHAGAALILEADKERLAELVAELDALTAG